VRDIDVGGVLRDLSHLADFIVKLAGKGKGSTDLRVRVSMSLHVVSRTCKGDEINDMRDENERPRVFCEDRYAFSLGLREIATRMIEQKYYCWESHDRNRAVNYAIIDLAPGRARRIEDGEHHVIYFYLHPDKSANSDVILRITSCHMRPMTFANVKRRYDMHTVLRKCLFEGKRLP
jgi:hypothetical protein